MKDKLSLIRNILIASLALTVLVLVAKTYLTNQKIKENEAAKQQIQKTFEHRYRYSDSLVELVPTDSLRARYKAIRKQRGLAK